MSERFPSELWNDQAFHKGREWGRMEERERIIKLLEDNLQDDSREGIGIRDEDDEMWCVARIKDIVALIRGEA